MLFNCLIFFTNNACLSFNNVEYANKSSLECVWHFSPLNKKDKNAKKNSINCIEINKNNYNFNFMIRMWYKLDLVL